MPNPKKILVISPVLIPPAKGGNSARIDSFCNALEDLNHEVHFLYISNIPGFDTTTNIEDAVKERWGDKFHHLDNKTKHQLAPQQPRNLKMRISNKILHTFKSDRFYTNEVDDFIGDKTIDYVQKLQNKLKFNLVICNYVVLSKLLMPFGKEVRKVIDTHDILGNRHLLFHQRKTNNKWISITPSSEFKSLNRADVIIGIQEAETEYFKKRTDKKVITLKHFVKDNAIDKSNCEPNSMLYIASGNSTNLDAWKYFKEQIFPTILSENPTAKVYVAGSISKFIKPSENINLIGFVDSLKSAYEKVKIAINPVTIGTGLKIKTIESLSYNTPIVTNEKGAIGLDSFREKGMIVTKSEDEFASKINDLLTDKSFFTSTNSNLSKAIKDYISLNSKQLDIVINGK